MDAQEFALCKLMERVENIETQAHEADLLARVEQLEKDNQWLKDCLERLATSVLKLGIAQVSATSAMNAHLETHIWKAGGTQPL